MVSPYNKLGLSHRKRRHQKRVSPFFPRHAAALAKYRYAIPPKFESYGTENVCILDWLQQPAVIPELSYTQIHNVGKSLFSAETQIIDKVNCMHWSPNMNAWLSSQDQMDRKRRVARYTVTPEFLIEISECDASMESFSKENLYWNVSVLAYDPRYGKRRPILNGDPGKRRPLCGYS